MDIDKKELSKIYDYITNNLRVGSIAANYSAVTDELIKKMFSNLSITTPITRIIREIGGMETKIETDYPDVSDKEVEDTKERFSNIKGFSDCIDAISMVPFTKYAIHEKIYKQDKNGYPVLGELKIIPREYVDYDIVKYKNGWYINSFLTGQEIEITDSKFIVSVYKQTIDQPMGQSLFKYGVVQAFEDLERLEGQLRALETKYGNVIPIFGYDPVDAETKEGIERIKARGEMLKELNGVGVMAVPLGGYQKSLGDSVHFITLDDLKLDQHAKIIEKLDKKIELFIMGANFSDGDGGSYSRDQVQAGEKDKITNHIVKFVATELNKILSFNSYVRGEYLNTYYYNFIVEKSGSEKAELRKKEAEADKLEGEAMQQKALGVTEIANTIADLKFRGVNNDEISRILDIDLEIVKKVEAKESVGKQGVEFEGVAQSGITSREKGQGHRKPFKFTR